jgi:hypothetical protein
MMRARMNGGTIYDALRSDLAREPRTPIFEAELGDLVRFRLLSYGSTVTHSFHVHGHVWWDEDRDRYNDTVLIPAGDSREVMFYAGGPAYRKRFVFKNGEPTIRSGAGDWLYHCHVVPHVKHGMWGIFRVVDPTDGGDEGGESKLGRTAESSSVNEPVNAPVDTSADDGGSAAEGTAAAEKAPAPDEPSRLDDTPAADEPAGLDRRR